MTNYWETKRMLERKWASPKTIFIDTGNPYVGIDNNHYIRRVIRELDEKIMNAKKEWLKGWSDNHRHKTTTRRQALHCFPSNYRC